MKRLETNENTNLTQSMKSGSDIVRMNNDDTMSMASLGMSGHAGNNMSMVSLE